MQSIVKTTSTHVKDTCPVTKHYTDTYISNERQSAAETIVILAIVEVKNAAFVAMEYNTGGRECGDRE